MQEERCAQFIKNLDGYAREILLERRKIESQLQEAIKELKNAKKKRSSLWGSLLGGVRDVCEGISNFFQPAELGAAVCNKVLNLM